MDLMISKRSCMLNNGFMKSKLLGFTTVLLILCLLTGCIIKPKNRNAMGRIKGYIECEFRVGKDAKTHAKAIDTDVVFDKDKFVELFNENSQYSPTSLKHHTDECSLKINAQEQPDEWEEIFNSEINIKVLYDRQSRNVSVYEYRSKLYFFVLSMGSNSKPEVQGSYFMKLSKEMTDYWKPLLKEVREDAAEYQLKEYGSFSVEKTYSYDKEYSTMIIDSGDDVMIMIYDRDHYGYSSFTPCRKSDFWGICWEKDNYNIWIQSGDIGVVCYSKNGDKWEKNSEAVRPDYIVSKYDK